MKRYYIFLGLVVLLTAGTLLVTCSTATNPFNEIVTSYKRDYDYLDRTFFWLFWPEDSVAKIIDGRIYVFQPKVDITNQDIVVHNAQTAVYPDNYGQYPEEDRMTTVKELTPDTYNIYKDDLYLEMITYDRNRLIAGWFEVETTAGDTVQVGNIDNDTLTLKLIALQKDEADKTCRTFKNEWRNVYSLGGPPIDTQYLELEIYLGEPGTETTGDNLCHQEGTPFIMIMGLDKVRQSNGYRGQDNRVDFNDRSIFWPEKGYLFFPNSKPFDPDTSYAISNTSLKIRVPEIYEIRRSTIMSNPLPYTKYYFKYKMAQ
jgi:cell surface protein SprA